MSEQQLLRFGTAHTFQLPSGMKKPGCIFAAANMNQQLGPECRSIDELRAVIRRLRDELDTAETAAARYFASN